MTDVVISNKDVVVEVKQPTIPPAAPPPRVGLVEINQVVQRGSAWMTGHGPPTLSGGQFGDMYLDMDTGDVYLWDGDGWVYQGTFAPSTLTPEEILAALLTVDGPGSALDADLLDGQHGAYYARQSDMNTQTAKNTAQDTQLADHELRISGNETNITALYGITDDNADDIGALQTGLAAETSARTSADTTLQGNINSEATARANADTTEATTRANADTTLDGKITTEKNRNDAQDTAIAGKVGEAPNDGVQYVRQSLAWSPVSVPPGTYVGLTPPANPPDNQMWMKSDTGALYLFYNDGNSKQWIQQAAYPQLAGNYALKTAEANNRIINASMQVSQENGNTAVTTSGGYPVDQWQASFTAGSWSYQQVKVGAGYRIRMTCTTAKASLAAGDQVSLNQKIEGSRTIDLSWGNADAKQVVLRFGFKGPAGTYSVFIPNAANTRSYLANFTITAAQANTDTLQTLVIPGDVTGVWATDNTAGPAIVITLAVGTTYQGVAGWQAGAFFGTAANTNGAAVAGNTFEIWDVGFHSDPDKTGIAPPFVMRPFADAMADCQRYWQNMGPVYISSYGTAGAGLYESYSYPTVMRVQPSVGFFNLANISNVQNLVLGINNTMTVGAGVTVIASGMGLITFYVTANARM